MKYTPNGGLIEATMKNTDASEGALRCCVDCANWKSCGELKGAGHYDVASGQCGRNGLQCPPLHSCPGWE